MDMPWKPDKKMQDWIDFHLTKEVKAQMNRLEKEALALVNMGYEPSELTIRSFPNSFQDVLPTVLIEGHDSWQET